MNYLLVKSGSISLFLNQCQLENLPTERSQIFFKLSRLVHSCLTFKDPSPKPTPCHQLQGRGRKDLGPLRMGLGMRAPRVPLGHQGPLNRLRMPR